MHFFIEVDKFSQSASQKYGPVSDNENTQYRVTSKFTANNNAKAFAVTAGKIFAQVQSNNSSLLNIILEPTKIDNIGFTPVKYFIYRGISKDSFIKNNAFMPKNDGLSTELTNAVWQRFDEAVAKRGSFSITAPQLNDFGLQYNNSNKIDSKLVDDVMWEQDNQNQLEIATEGMYIGRFANSSDCGFEIVLKNKFYSPIMGEFRSGERIITIGSFISSATPGREDINLMAKREDILNFIDPAAYFNLFSEVGINFKSSIVGGIQIAFGYSNVYDKLTSKFATKNTVYIDIRNENGYSLNYYKDNEGQVGDTDYGKHIQIAIDGGTYSKISYYKNYWPIYSFIPGNNTTTENNVLDIKFQNLYNPLPIIYLDFAHLIKKYKLVKPIGDKKFLDEGITEIPNAGWSNKFRIYIPNIPSLSSYTQPAWYIKLINIRKIKRNNVYLPDTCIPKDNYLDNVFTLIKDISSIKFKTGTTRWITNLGKKYIYFSDYPFDIGGIVETGICINDNHVMLYGRVTDYFYNTIIKKSNNIITKQPKFKQVFNGTSIGNNLNNFFKHNLPKYDFYYEEKIIGTETIKIPMIQHNISCEYPYDFASITFSRQQYNDLTNVIFQSLDPNVHQPLLKFYDYENIEDQNNVKRKHTKLQISSLNNSGIEILTNANSSFDIFYYHPLIYSAKLPFNFLLPIKVKDTKPLSYNELLNFTKEIEKVYATTSKFNNILLDDTSDKTVTRFRTLFYGKPIQDRYRSKTTDHFIKVIKNDINENMSRVLQLAFNLAIPDAPYYEPNPHAKNTILPHTINTVPPSFKSEIFLNLSKFTYRERSVYSRPFKPFSFTGEEVKQYTLDRLNNCDQLVKINSQNIDFGHALLGLDSLLHPGNPASKPAKPFRNVPKTEGFDLQYSIDFTSFIGDLASVLVNAYYEVGYNPNLVSNQLLDKHYDGIGFGLLKASDLYGDIDIWGLKAAWDKISNNGTNTNFKLSNVLEHYYGNTIPFDNNSNPSHVSKRFTIFCKANGLLNTNSSFLFTSSKQNEWEQRLKKFAVSFNTKYTDLVNQIALGNTLLQEKETVNTTKWFDSFSSSHISYLVLKFKNIIKTNYELE